MKTVMKKIFSLMLVAVLLVSAVPFAASAAEVTKSFDLTLAPGTYSVDTILADTYDTASTNYWVHRTAPTAEDYLRGKSFDAVEGGTYTLYVVEIVADPDPEPATLTCETCKETYTEGTEHTCPTVTCETCKETYTKGTEHECPTTTCGTCGHVYVTGTEHTCAKETCEKCGVTYIKAQGHTCTVPAEPVIRRVTFVADRVDRTKIFWEVNVQDGKSVYYPGITPDSDWDCLNDVGDIENYAFMGWSTNKDATSGDTTATVVRQAISGGDRTYYAIYREVTVDPPTSSKPGNITNKDNTNKVYLHVYLNGNASVIQTTRDITETTLLDDDKISAAEIHTYLTKTLQYYGPKDTTKGVQIDGLYVNTGSSGTFPQNYYTDDKVSELDNISSLLDNGYVHVNVMMKNVAVSSGYTADSSNPKTGDMIMAPVAILGLSASALAVLFFLNKKRAF